MSGQWGFARRWQNWLPLGFGLMVGMPLMWSAYRSHFGLPPLMSLNALMTLDILTRWIALWVMNAVLAKSGGPWARYVVPAIFGLTLLYLWEIT
ncbi:MAG: hypothetical protein JNN06_07925, partial [Gemmobacter sp.]|nr:hypothetical protein [Gemmobacter sp.]